MTGVGDEPRDFAQFIADTRRKIVALERRQIRGDGGGGNASSLQPGMISAHAGGSVPPGWFLADGSPYDPTQYPDLFAAIGNSWGGTLTAPLLPDLRGRTIVGRDASQVEFDTLGERGGEKAHTLTVAEMPSHLHGAATGGSLVQSGAGGAGANVTTGGGGFVLNTTSNTGGGGPHNNLQPYAVANWIIAWASGSGPQPIIVEGPRQGTAAERASTFSTYWALWQDTDGAQGLYVGNRSGGWRLFSGVATIPAAAWDTTQGSAPAAILAARTATVVLPTVLEANEWILFQAVTVGTGFGFASGVNLTRGATNTSLALRLMQLMNATVTQSFQIAWQIVQQ